MRVMSGNLNSIVKVRGDDAEYKVDDKKITVEGSLDDYSCPQCESLLVHGTLVIYPASGDTRSDNDADAVWCPVCYDVF